MNVNFNFNPKLVGYAMLPLKLMNHYFHLAELLRLYKEIK